MNKCRAGHDLATESQRQQRISASSNSPHVLQIFFSQGAKLHGWNHILQPHIPSGDDGSMGDLLSYQEVPELFKTQPASCSFCQRQWKRKQGC